MKKIQFFASATAAAVILLLTSIASAVPLLDIVYDETDIGGGNWQYDYTIYNNSTAGEALIEVDFILPQIIDMTGTSLPVGWDGIVWMGPNTTDFLNVFATDFPYEILAGESLGGFSFTTDSGPLGDLDYEAISSDFDFIQGTSTAAVPEPTSLLLLGSGLVGFVALRRKKK